MFYLLLKEYNIIILTNYLLIILEVIYFRDCETVINNIIMTNIVWCNNGIKEYNVDNMMIDFE